MIFEKMENLFNMKLVSQGGKDSIIQRMIMSKGQLKKFYIRTMKINKITRRYKETYIHCLIIDNNIKLILPNSKCGIIFQYGENEQEEGYNPNGWIYSSWILIVPNNIIQYTITCFKLYYELKRANSIELDYVIY